MIQEISPKFLYHKKRSAMDAHSRDRNMLHKLGRARRENVASDILFFTVKIVDEKIIKTAILNIYARLKND